MQQEIQKIIAITLTTSAERIPERPGKHENPVFFVGKELAARIAPVPVRRYED
jgi:hypothetical protein